MKKTNIKKPIVLGIILFALALNGCGKNKNPETSSNEQTAVETEEKYSTRDADNTLIWQKSVF